MPPLWRAVTESLDWDLSLQQTIWQALCQSDDPEARATVFAAQTWTINAHYDSLRHFVCGSHQPSRFVQVLERLVAAKLLKRKHATQAEELILRHTSATGQWLEYR
jgi:DNA repair ATPase RecN